MTPANQFQDQVSRRRAMKVMGGISAAISAPTIVPATALGRNNTVPPSERIQLGIIGVNSMGLANLKNCSQYEDVEVTGICDVWKKRRDHALALHPTAKEYLDYQELLGADNIDAVIIATPPHWHALMAIHAVEASKDIYLQKPMTMYPDESLAVRNAIRQHNRVSQIGTQIHAGDNYRRVVEWIRSGKLGPVSVVRTFNVMNQGRNGLGRAPSEQPPTDLDWQRWLGPGPMRDYNSLLVASGYEHCSFWDYSGGWTLGMGPHIVDLPVWALELGVPTVTSCSGGRYFIQDDGDAPDTQEVLWQYPNLTMHWSMSACNSFGFDFGRGTPDRRLGIYFHAAAGTLFTNYSKHEIVPEGDYLPDTIPPEKSIPTSPGHEREWLDCVKSRKQPSCNVDYHYKVDLALTLANLSYRLDRSVHVDPQTERIVGDPEATKLARPVYRDPWRFPAEYL